VRGARKEGRVTQWHTGMEPCIGTSKAVARTLFTSMEPWNGSGKAVARTQLASPSDAAQRAPSPRLASAPPTTWHRR
jgi:hypothetical protein